MNNAMFHLKRRRRIKLEKEIDVQKTDIFHRRKRIEDKTSHGANREDRETRIPRFIELKNLYRKP